MVRIAIFVFRLLCDIKTQDGILFQMHQGYATWNELNVVCCKSHLAKSKRIVAPAVMRREVHTRHGL